MYCATKFAVDALTTATRHDVIESSNVRVSAISPGAVKTGNYITFKFCLAVRLWSSGNPRQ